MASGTEPDSSAGDDSGGRLPTDPRERARLYGGAAWRTAARTLAESNVKRERARAQKAAAHEQTVAGETSGVQGASGAPPTSGTAPASGSSGAPPTSGSSAPRTPEQPSPPHRPEPIDRPEPVGRITPTSRRSEDGSQAPGPPSNPQRSTPSRAVPAGSRTAANEPPVEASTQGDAASSRPKPDGPARMSAFQIARTAALRSAAQTSAFDKPPHKRFRWAAIRKIALDILVTIAALIVLVVGLSVLGVPIDPATVVALIVIGSLLRTISLVVKARRNLS